jgi:hypothetical protein
VFGSSSHTHQATTVGDPKTTFFTLVPSIVWVVDSMLGLKLLIAVITADSLNAVLKLPFRGDRPFWVFSDLRQFDMTCETGLSIIHWRSLLERWAQHIDRACFFFFFFCFFHQIRHALYFIHFLTCV